MIKPLITLCCIVLSLFAFDACAQNTTSANQGQAYTKCLAAHANAIATWNTSQYDNQETPGCTPAPLSYQKWYSCGYQRRAKTCPTCGWTTVNCGAHYYDTACAALPPLGAGWFQTGTGPTCKDGCQYGDSAAGEYTNVTLFPGSPGAIAFRNEQGGQIPTGGVCGANSEGPKPLEQETCKTVGTLTQCMMPNGKHCAQAGSGKKFCWNPTEAGTKVSGNEGATKSPEGKPNLAPPIPPTNNGQWEQSGSGTTTVNHNGSTTNYNNNTYNSSNGNTGDGGGATNPDGGEDDGGDDENEAGTPGDGVGELYQGNGDKTVASVFGAFRARVTGSAIISAVGSFFTVNATGACPVWTLSGSDWWEAATFDAHCSGDIAQVLGSIGWVLLAIAGFFAAREALS